MESLKPKFNAQGLIPAIVQDANTKDVLMLAWMNAEALSLTLETGQVTFWSRSRNELWRKGATSGNTLELVELRLDCDEDAILVLAHPAGPTCHTGATSCFFRPLSIGTLTE
jgi:phosphoribosyl-AMP cyclohydrolase